MIRAIAIDDEPPALEVISRFAAQTEKLNLLESFTSISAAREFIKENNVDLIFLDIDMPAMSGIDFYKSLNRELKVIFTTAYSEFALEGFNLSAIDYLLKPFDFARFSQAVNKAIEYHTLKMKHEDTEHLLLKADYGIQRIDPRDILLVEGLADYVKVYMTDKPTLIVRITMKEMISLLPVGFMRVHRSYIVPLRHIESLRNKKISIAGHVVPVGKTYLEAFNRRYLNKGN